MKLTIRFIPMICVLLAAAWLTACSQKTNEHQGHQNQQHQPTGQSQPLRIEFNTNPAPAEAGKPVTLTSTVKAGNESVNDATVEFEVWKKGQKEHQKFGAKRQQNGTYTASASFREAGEYVTIVHVTTPKTHQMASGAFTVGQASGHSHGDHGDHGNGVQLHIQFPSQARSGKPITVIGHVQRDGNPLTDAEVQFEYWKEGEQKHEWTDTAERNPGEYLTTIRFSEPGTYRVKLHVEKGEIHDHKEETYIVK
ncbi:FixH family protein [Lihuaxuella thermophila]|uniref:YtkA-like n=1 Tax=Lihuaxuella thermophila TaxID=1173111 RepID=A0A1H8HUH9_9BACL|nr:FixH family protein [Lihuaxuella thermophila]SEN59328.1 YtkA-like [Lihuaxuella thermophila]